MPGPAAGTGAGRPGQLPMVLARSAAPVVAAAPAPPDVAASPPTPVAASVDVTALTSQVIQQLDRRLVAYRERMGRV